MLVASNTSPISNLAIIGRLNILKVQFQEIWIPGAVQSELGQLSGVPLKQIQQAIEGGWIQLRKLQDDRVARLLEATLDRGEAEAIALALEMSANLILLDEKEGRAVAERAGLQVTGILGVLLRGQEVWGDRGHKARVGIATHAGAVLCSAGIGAANPAHHRRVTVKIIKTGRKTGTGF